MMKLKNRYFLLRHGENIYQVNKKGYIYPSKDSKLIKLTKKGENQVKESLKEIKKEKIDLIYSSNFYRTKETAKIASKQLGIKQINFDKRLKDLNQGVFRSRKKEEYYKHFPDPKKRFANGPKGGESWSDLKIRINSFLKSIEKKYKNKKILIVSHGDPLWILEGIIKDLTNQQLLDEIFVKKNYIKVGELRKVN